MDGHSATAQPVQSPDSSAMRLISALAPSSYEEFAANGQANTPVQSPTSGSIRTHVSDAAHAVQVSFNPSASPRSSSQLVEQPPTVDTTITAPEASPTQRVIAGAGTAGRIAC
jgi:hypothetical protein